MQITTVLVIMKTDTFLQTKELQENVSELLLLEVRTAIQEQIVTSAGLLTLTDRLIMMMM